MKPVPTAEGIITAFENVEKQLNTLCLHIHDALRSYPVWADRGDRMLVSERDMVIYALKHLKPTAGLSPQETFACMGAVGCTLTTLALIDKVNAAKDNFRQTVDDYLKQFSSAKRDTAIIREILARHVYSGIKLKQVYRHIKYLDHHPRRISFTQVEHSANKTITRQMAEKLLQEAGEGRHIEVQLEKVSLLGQHDKLIIRRDIHNCWLVNVATFKNQEGRSSFTKIWTSLPLFYLHDERLPYPQVGFSKTYNKHKEGPRIDKRLEDKPFLSSISAYRYKRSTS
jgi:hypothetical protein